MCDDHHVCVHGCVTYVGLIDKFLLGLWSLDCSSDIQSREEFDWMRYLSPRSSCYHHHYTTNDENFRKRCLEKLSFNRADVKFINNRTLLKQHFLGRVHLHTHTHTHTYNIYIDIPKKYSSWFDS